LNRTEELVLVEESESVLQIHSVEGKDTMSSNWLSQ